MNCNEREYAKVKSPTCARDTSESVPAAMPQSERDGEFDIFSELHKFRVTLDTKVDGLPALEAQGLFDEPVLKLLREVRDMVGSDVTLATIVQQIIDVFICVTNLHSSQGYMGVLSSIYLICSHFGIGRAKVIAPIVAFAKIYLFPDILDDNRVMSFLETINVSIEDICTYYDQINDSRSSDEESSLSGSIDSEDEYSDEDYNLAHSGLPEDITLAGMMKLRKVSGLHAQAFEKVSLDAFIDALRQPERFLGEDSVGGKIIRFLRAAMGIGLMTSMSGDFNVAGVKMFSLRPDKYASGANFLSTLAEVLQSFADYGFACMSQGTMFPRKEMDRLDAFELEVREIKSQLALFELGCLDKAGQTRHGFMLRVDQLIKESKYLLGIEKDKYTRAGLLVCYEALMKVHTKCIAIYRASKLKYTPFGVTIYGNPGVGKSSITDMMMELFFTWKQVKENWYPDMSWREFFVAVNLDDPFGSNEFPFHLMALGDDFMSKRPEKCSLNNLPFNWVIKTCNPIPSTILKPDVDSKGACIYQYEIVVITVNKKDAWAGEFCTDEFAFHRRLGFVVTVSVKKRFRIDNSNGLDSDKTDGSENYWRFDVEYVVQGPDGRTRWLPHYTDEGFPAVGIDIEDFMRIYQREWNRWDDAQKEYLARKNTAKPMKLCKCGIPERICRSCKYNQSVVDYCMKTNRTMLPTQVRIKRRDNLAAARKLLPDHVSPQLSLSENQDLLSTFLKDDTSELPPQDVPQPLTLRQTQRKIDELLSGGKSEIQKPDDLNAEAIIVPAHIANAVYAQCEAGENPSRSEIEQFLSDTYSEYGCLEWIQQVADHLVATIRDGPDELLNPAEQLMDMYGDFSYIYPDRDENVWKKVEVEQKENFKFSTRDTSTSVYSDYSERTEDVLDLRTPWQRFKSRCSGFSKDLFVNPTDIHIEFDVSQEKTYFESLDETIRRGSGDTWQQWFKYQSACFWSFGFYQENSIRVPWYINMLPDVYKNFNPNVVYICALTSQQMQLDHMCVTTLFVLQVLSILYWCIFGNNRWKILFFNSIVIFYIYYIAEKYFYIRSRHNAERGDSILKRYVYSRLTSEQRDKLKLLKYAGLALAGAFIGCKIFNAVSSPKKVLPGKEPKQEQKQPEACEAEGATYSFANVKPVWAQVEAVNGEGVTTTKYTTDQLMSVVAKNQCVATIYSKDGLSSSRCNAIMIGHGMVIFPYHILPDEYVKITLHVGKSVAAGNCISAYVHRQDGYNMTEKDLSVQHIAQVGDRKVLLRFFPECTQVADHVCKTVFRRLNTGEVEGNTHNVRLRPDDFTSQYGSEEKKLIKGYLGDYTRLTEKGLCGQLYIAHSKQPFIHSIHVAGKDTRVGSVSFLKEDFNQACEFFKNKPGKLLIAESSEFSPNRDGYSFDLKPTPSEKSPLNFLGANTTFEYYGTVETRVPRFKSKVKKTIICDSVCTEFDVGLCAKPPPDVPTWQHHHACIENTTKTNAGFPQKFVELAAEDYMKKVGPTFEVQNRGRIKPLTLEECVNGVPGVRGLEPMNRKTSAGYPYFKPKNKLCEIVDDKMYLTERQIQSYELSLEQWKKGVRTYEVFSQSLKDEAVKLTKEVTRTFQCSNLNLTLGLRMFYGPILASLLTNPALYETAIGVNAESHEWEALIKATCKYGEDRIIAGDYKNYDQRMSSQVTMASMWILIELAKLADFDQETLEVMNTLASEVMFPVIYMNGDLFKLLNTTPSGHSLTTITNCEDNAIYLRMAYYALAMQRKLKHIPLYHNVSALSTYGDDNFMSVRKNFEWYNHTAIAKFFKEFDVVYTMAIKDQESVPFISISDLQFLKRDVFKDKELNAYLAPLDEKSIFKSLQFVCDTEFTPEQSAATNIDNAISAYFQHGREKFEAVIPKLRKIVQDHSLEQFSVYWDKDYDFFKRRWIEKYRTGRYPLVIYPEPPGYKVEDGGDVKVYDDNLVRELRELSDACIGQAVEPDSTPLFSGGEADQTVLQLGH